MFLTCSCRSGPRIEYVYVAPPKQYLEQYPVPEIRGHKNRDLLVWALDMQEIIKMHNADKQALADWRAGIDTENTEDEQ